MNDYYKTFSHLKRPTFIIRPEDLRVRNWQFTGPIPRGSKIHIDGQILDAAIPPGMEGLGMALSLFGGEEDPWVLMPLSCLEEVIHTRIRELVAAELECQIPPALTATAAIEVGEILEET